MMDEMIKIEMPKEHWNKMMDAQKLILELGEDISEVVEPEYWEKILDAFA